MAITNLGFAGPVDPQDWYYLNTLASQSIYGIRDKDDLILKIKTGTDRTISVSPGQAWGRGIYTTSTATESVTLPSISSGSRWDMVVLRRDWNTKTAAFTYVKGTSQKKLPTRNTAVGTLDDQPLILARVEAGKSDVQEIIDLKCWANNGAMIARDEMTLGYLDQTGTSVVIGRNDWVNTTGSGWQKRAGAYDSGWVNGTFGSGWGSYKGGTAYVKARKVSIGAGAYLVDVRVRVMRTGAKVDIFSSGNVVDQTIARIPSWMANSGVAAGLTSGVSGRSANGYITSSGNVTLATVARGYNNQYIEKGDHITLGGTFVTDLSDNV